MPAKGQWREFGEAREFVRGLGLKSYADWREWAKSSKRPVDIPANPDQVYKGRGWQGLGDWLGTGNIAPYLRDYRPFEEAREYARGLGLKNQAEWRAYCKSGKKPTDIPSAPDKTYASAFDGYGDWLGTGRVYARQWRPLEEARVFVRELNLKDVKEWQEYCKSGKKPDDIPSYPHDIYGSEFDGYGDWLGTGTVATFNRQYRPFEEAREFVQSLGLKNQHEWHDYCKTGRKPRDIPSNPHKVYEEFDSYGDWIGTGAVHPRSRQYRPFEEARDYVRKQGLKSNLEWRNYCKTGRKPHDIPANPETVYDEFKGYSDWLGVVSRWNSAALLALLEDLRPQLPNLEESELYAILQQGGAMPALREKLGNVTPMQAMRVLKEGGDEIEAVIKATPEELDAALESRSAAPDDEVLPAQSAEPDGETIFEPPEIDRDQDGLPTLVTPAAMRAVDALAETAWGLDDETAEFLVQNRVAALWVSYTNKDMAPVREALEGNGGHYFDLIRKRFYSELNSVHDLPIPDEWAFTDDGVPAPPNIMQRRAAWEVLTKGRVGNWSGVGSGKTLSAVLASRVVGARCTLVITNNATVSGWARQIREAFPDSKVFDQVPDALPAGRFCYIVLNYEKFQQVNRGALVASLLALAPVFVVLDEVQLVKQRDGDVSLRRKTIEGLISALAEKNPDLRVLGMSATPVINNLLEARKLLEIVSGRSHADLGTQATVNNAQAVHRALMINGFRYKPDYKIEMNQPPIEATHNELLPELRSCSSPLEVEQALLPAKLALIAEHVRRGTIIYTHYVAGMIGPTRAFFEDRGFRVGLYMGDDKSGFTPFLRCEVDVLIGSQPVGTGLDGLQTVCDRMIMLSLPWTGAEYEQIIGRIRRQGSAFGSVSVIVPQILLEHDGDIWSWDRGRMATIDFKRDLSSCAVDGGIPETVRISPNALLRQSRKALERWIARIGEEGMLSLEREQLRVPLPSDIRERLIVRRGDFTELNNRWSTSNSTTVHERLQANPEEWYLYHTLYREARESWEEIPAEYIAGQLRDRPEWRVGDFGCGECLLRDALPSHTVIGIDHVAIDPSVVACDMAHTSLEDASFDAAVFSLSLMGHNWRDYLLEAHRVLKPFGFLFVAEPTKKWTGKEDTLTQAVKDSGYEVVRIYQRSGFTYVQAMKVG